MIKLSNIENRKLAIKIQKLVENEYKVKMDMSSARIAAGFIISNISLKDKELISKPDFNITEEYYKRNFEKIKQELQSDAEGTAEMCGENSEEHKEAIVTRDKILNGDLEELGAYLSEVYYAVHGEPEKYCPGDKTFIELIQDLNREELCQNTEYRPIRPR